MVFDLICRGCGACAQRIWDPTEAVSATSCTDCESAMSVIGIDFPAGRKEVGLTSILFLLLKDLRYDRFAAASAEELQMTGLVTKHLKKGERIRIAGLGILQVRKRAARMGRNPATGEAIKIKASKKVAFRAAKDLKLAI